MLHTASHCITIQVRLVVTALGKVFPRFNYSWLADELARGLPQELNFVNEGRNAELCSQHFAHRADVIVPAIHWHTTSPRVLTMVRHPGLCVTVIYIYIVDSHRVLL
jgi:aarF domain-containing kinase